MASKKLESAPEFREDKQYQAAIRRREDTRLVPVWRGRFLVANDTLRPLFPAIGEAPALLNAAEELIYLGRDGDRAFLAADLAPDEEPPAVPGASFRNWRSVAAHLSSEDIAVLGYASGMSHWHRHARFDPSDGQPTTIDQGGATRLTASGNRLFPRIDPAVMVLVTYQDRCLLARQAGFPPGMYSALAGFVELGESLEDCVIRETREEVGLDVTDLRYFGSQPWPFPRSLMVAFQARATGSDFVVDGKEIEAARWFTADEVLAPQGFSVPPPFAIAHQLIRSWAA